MPAYLKQKQRDTSKQGRLNLFKLVGAHLTSKTNFYGKKLNSYEQLIKVVGACAPSAPLVPPPMPQSIKHDASIIKVFVKPSIYPNTTVTSNI